MSATADEFAQMRRALEQMSDEELMGDMWGDYMHLRELQGIRQGEAISEEALYTWMLDYLRHKVKASPAGEGEGDETLA